MSIRKSCLAAVLTLLAALPLHSSPLPLTPRQLAARAPHVVVAVVEDTRSLWNAEHTLIVTEYGLRVEDRLKGDAAERVTLTVPGGTVGGETHVVSLSPSLAMGSRYLLFLEDFNRPTLTPVTAFPESAGGFGETVRAARELIAEVEAHPKAADAEWRVRAEDPTLPSKAWDPAGAKFLVEYPPIAPVAFNLIQPGNRFYHVDWDQMAYWNVYAGELFRPSPNPSPTWAFGNGVFDVAGFTTDEQMRQQLGFGWGTGINTTIVRVQDGHVVEADLAFNPAYEWTLDDDAATRPGGPFSFKRIVLSGLGHAWGYGSERLETTTGPPIQRDSVMHSLTPPFNLPILFAEDAQAARSTFGGPSLKDGLITAYSLKNPAGAPIYLPVRASVSSVRPGASFKLVKPVKIENAGTEDIADPTVGVYLVPKRFSLEGAIFLKQVQLRGTVGSGEFRTLDLGRVKLPPSVPAGTYYFAFVLNVPEDGYPANNRAWSNPNVKIKVKTR
jgi:hypothetical protein